jgi:hypothetical protein
MRAHVRFALYRDVLRVLAQLEEPGPDSGMAGDLSVVLASLATLTPPGCRQRKELLQCLEGVLERFGAVAPFDEAPEMQQAA